MEVSSPLVASRYTGQEPHIANSVRVDYRVRVKGNNRVSSG